MRKNVLVFPCGSEIGLEVYRSLKNSKHFRLIGANSVSDHGRFVFTEYIGNIPFVTSPYLIPRLTQIVKEYQIDFIYPTMDSVISILKEHENELMCTVISSPATTTEICFSKDKTYKYLSDCVAVPRCYDMSEIDNIGYPVFCKPKVGYGSRGAKKVDNINQLRQYREEYPDSLIMEFLSGDEYTVDCFTDKNRNLLFCGSRKRQRISNGISVNTYPIDDTDGEFRRIAEKINNYIEFRGAWFIQLKRDDKGQLVLLEIASRLGGSSSVFRAKGINFAQLSLFDAMGYDVSIIENEYYIEMDRALDNKYKIKFSFDEVFIDYDDTLILENKFYNTDVLKFLYQCRNEGKKITLISSHNGNLVEHLKSFGLNHLFDRVIHTKKIENKADYIDNCKAIFIDDSFIERKRVASKGIPVFSLDMVEAFL